MIEAGIEFEATGYVLAVAIARARLELVELIRSIEKQCEKKGVFALEVLKQFNAGMKQAPLEAHTIIKETKNNGHSE
jgi:hypothetical protein